MRPLLFTLLIAPLLRQSIIASARRIPAIEHPICRRNFTCSPPSQFFPTIMAELSAENQAVEEIERLAKSKECENGILSEPSGRKEAVEQKVEVEKSDLREEEKLPKLSAADFRVYNSMAEHMEYFHNHFRHSWNLLYKSCESGSRPRNMSLRQFLMTGLQFCGHLSTHHSIEEHHIFPVLAKKMPEFKNGPNYKGAAELLRQHKAIHEGMDVFEEYLRQCKDGETELDLRILKTKMDTWGEVLWTHLDQEVKTLGAENMRKHWTLEEMRRMPM